MAKDLAFIEYTNGKKLFTEEEINYLQRLLKTRDLTSIQERQDKHQEKLNSNNI